MGIESRKSTSKRVLSYATLALACVFAYVLGMLWRPSDAVDNAGLRIDERYLDFGLVWAEPRFIWRMQMENPTREEIRVTGFSSSCNCVAVQPNEFSVPAGASKEVTLLLNLAPSAANGVSQDLREFSAHLTPRIAKARVLPAGWTITGRVRWAVCFSANPLNISDGFVRGKHWTPVTERLVPQVAGARLSVMKCDPPIVDTLLQRDPK